MRNLYYILFAGLVVLCMYSCNSKPQTRQQQIEDFREQLTKEDTTEMLKLCDDAMERLKAHDYDGVLANLYEYTDSTKEVKKITKETSKRYMNLFKMFPVLEYQRNYYSFMLEGCNDVKYKVMWAAADKTGTGEPAYTHYMFNPIRVDGKWQLCVKTPDDQMDMNRR